MKQSDWLRSLSERAGFLHPARSETQLPAVKCNCPLWFSRQKLRSETIFKRKNLPNTFEKHSVPRPPIHFHAMYYILAITTIWFHPAVNMAAFTSVRFAKP
jgi:hypothetical protein